MSLLTKASTVTTPTAYSEGLLHSVKPVESLGSELVTNGDFSDGTNNWTASNATLSIDGGALKITSTGGNRPQAYQLVTGLTVGKKYRLSAVAKQGTTTHNVEIEISGLGNPNNRNKNGTTTYQTIYADFTAGSTSHIIQAKIDDGAEPIGTTAFFQSISLKEVLGADFDFARASSATRVNEQGYIEKERENLVLYSSDQSNTSAFNIRNNINSVTAVSNPLTGQNDAYKILTTATADPYFGQNITTGLINGVNTFSCWLWTDSGQNTEATLFLYNADVSELHTKSITLTTTPTRYEIFANISDFKGTATLRLDLCQTCGITYAYTYGWQFEQGLVATDYIETTTSSVAVGITNDIPRINYENGIGNFLLEPQRTNNIIHSEYFQDSSWTPIGSPTIELGYESPDGNNNAVKLTRGSNSTPLRSGDVATIGSNNSFSIYAKAGTATKLVLDIGDEGETEFDLTSEWQRFDIVVNPSTYRFCDISMGASSSSGNYFYIYGAQCEAGASYPTSYIPSYGSAVTRAAETCNNAGNSDLFNDSEGVLYAEIAALDESVSSYNSIGLGSGNLNNRIGLGFEPPSSIYVFKRTTSSWLPKKSSEINVFNKVAISYNTNDNHFWLNGFKVSSDTTIGDISQPNELGFEASYGGEDFYGKTKMVSTFTEALSDSELECLTSWSSFERMATAQNYTIQ